MSSPQRPTPLHDLEKWQLPLAELGDETAEAGHTSRQALHVLEATRRLHLLDGFDLVGVCFDAAMRHQEIEEFA